MDNKHYVYYCYEVIPNMLRLIFFHWRIWEILGIINIMLEFEKTHSDQSTRSYSFHKYIIFIAEGCSDHPYWQRWRIAGFFLPPLREVGDAVPDACWPAAMIILISNFCALPHGKEEVGREMRALSRTSAGPHYMEEIFTCRGGRVYFSLGGWRKQRRSGVREENEEKAAPGRGSSGRFQFSTLMGYVVCEYMTGRDRSGVNKFISYIQP